MKRRKTSSDSSLELLLDTICNTFGGVLFIAILAAILLANSSKVESLVEGAKPMSEEEVEQLREQLTQSQARLDTARRDWQQQSNLAKQFADPNRAQRLEEIRMMEAERDALTDESREKIADTAKLYAEARKIQDDATKLEGAIKDAERKLEADRQALRAAREAAAQSTTLPRVRSTSKSPVAIIIRFGRMYVWHEYDRNNERIGPNKVDFVVDINSIPVKTIPKLNAGLPLEDGQADGIRAKLQRFNSSQFFIDAVVWPDSFEHFEVFKNQIIKMGFEYRLLPTSPGQPIFDRGGGGGVQ